MPTPPSSLPPVGDPPDAGRRKATLDRISTSGAPGTVHPGTPAKVHGFPSANGNEGVELNYGNGVLVHAHPGDARRPAVAHQVPAERDGLGGDQVPLSPTSQAVVFGHPAVQGEFSKIAEQRQRAAQGAKDNAKAAMDPPLTTEMARERANAAAAAAKALGGGAYKPGAMRKARVQPEE